eukprot:scaffold17414_cov53-Phaeocystis_antarctica.AAC.8
MRRSAPRLRPAPLASSGRRCRRRDSSWPRPSGAGCGAAGRPATWATWESRPWPWCSVTPLAQTCEGGVGAAEALTARRWWLGGGGKGVTARRWQGWGSEAMAVRRCWQAGGGEGVAARRRWGRGSGDAALQPGVVARWWWHRGGKAVVGKCPPEARRVLGCVLGACGAAVALVACAQRFLAPAPPLCVVQPGELVRTLWVRGVNRRLAVWELAGAQHELCARCVRGEEVRPSWRLANPGLRTDAPLRCTCRLPDGASCRALLLVAASAAVVYAADEDAAGKDAAQQHPAHAKQYGQDAEVGVGACLHGVHVADRCDGRRRRWVRHGCQEQELMIDHRHLIHAL